MLASVVFVPSAPLLVPELAGPEATDTAPVRDAVLAAVTAATPGVSSWIAIGVADEGTGAIDGVGHADPDGPDPDGADPDGADLDCADRARIDAGQPASGTFARFGVDLPVRLSTRGVPTAPGPLDPRLPLSMLIAGWLRGQMGVESIRPVTVAPAADPAHCADIGAALASCVDSDPAPVGVLVVGDGATALSAKAPGGGLRAEAVALQQDIDGALGSADRGALARLTDADCRDVGVGGRPAWQVAAALVGDRPVRSDVHYAGAPFGVGYVVATWTP
ncbi:hypothetical protein GYA93_07605 [Gordonia desulfuricans]|uniref:Uncharacterized protein n=1 Tax=Gordonia desulfuricans TaxID=89051 RepID=A0A7K3LMP0_9ACTN|nr:hypothetical protein [Gordonia desulfuricans]NDK89448.1 hypothetical protein [Gordonia desulfuricans]